MKNGERCEACRGINKVEANLNSRARTLTRLVRIHIYPTIERNNAKWRTFAKLVRMPVIGKLVKRLLVAPRNLEVPPLPFDEPWYRDAATVIETAAGELESLKQDDLEHWGREVVTTNAADDPGGYYTPHTATREWCINNNVAVGIPAKYDFHSMAGTNKMLVDSLVFCSDVNRILPAHLCDWSIGESTRWKTVYTSRQR